MKTNEFDYFDILELAAYITGNDPDDIDEEGVENDLQSQFHINGKDLHKLVERLLPLVEKNNVKGEIHKGFTDQKGNYFVIQRETLIQQ